MRNGLLYNRAANIGLSAAIGIIQNTENQWQPDMSVANGAFFVHKKYGLRLRLIVAAARPLVLTPSWISYVLNADGGRYTDMPVHYFAAA